MKLNDLYLIPAPFSTIASRKDVDTSKLLAGSKLSVPIIASPMDTVYSPALAKKTLEFGAQAIVHRFCTIEENVRLFLDGVVDDKRPWASIGLNADELDRASALVAAGCETFVIDVANGASESSVAQYRRLRDLFKINIVVGNFATGEQILAFNERAGTLADGYRVGVGTGSQCITQKDVTAVGLPPVQTILSTVSTGMPVIMDGGTTNPAAFCIALALGCSAVMMGRQFAATIESAAEPIYERFGEDLLILTKKRYRGSASKESYEIQGKTSSWRPVEGISSEIEATGSVETMLTEYQAALRSSMSYMNAIKIEDFTKNARWDVKSRL